MGAVRVDRLLDIIDPSALSGLGSQRITEEQYREIGAFTTTLVSSATSATDKYLKIFRWLYDNVTYNFSDNSPYAVFVNRKGVCQGYANLLEVMCESQGIPATIASGDLYQYGMPGYLLGGHAWNYVYVDGTWHIADPTNGVKFVRSQISEYAPYLDVWQLDCSLFPSHESLDLRYEHSQLTVSDVKPVRGPELVVPYSIKGVQITNFNPRTILSSVTDLYLGENIQNLGRPDLMRLSEAGLTVANIFIAPE